MDAYNLFILLKRFITLIDQISAFAKPIFVLSGGEPLFRPDIFDISRHASDAGLIVALATNGTLIDADVAHRIRAAGVRPGLCITLTVAGFNLLGDGLRDVLDPRWRSRGR